METGKKEIVNGLAHEVNMCHFLIVKALENTKKGDICRAFDYLNSAYLAQMRAARWRDDLMRASRKNLSDEEGRLLDKEDNLYFVTNRAYMDIRQAIKELCA